MTGPTRSGRPDKGRVGDYGIVRLFFTWEAATKVKLASALLLSAALLVSQVATAAERVDLALVLAVDVSASVNDQRFHLQREGYAAALTNSDVLRAISGGPHGTIALAFIEWAGAYQQKVVLGWTVIRSSEDATIIANMIRAAPRSFEGSTAIGAAIDFGAQQFATGSVQAERRIIDVSGDGTNNDGPSVTRARDQAVAAGITINGLAILVDPTVLDSHSNPPGGLPAYYGENVIGGPGAFVMAVENPEIFTLAIRDKLIREIAMDPAAPMVARVAPAALWP